jgi:TonB family protein
VHGRGYDWQGSKYFLLYLPREISLDTLASATSLRLERSGRRLLDVPVPSLQRAVPVARQCMNDVLREWGFDPETYNALRQPPRSIGSIAGWVDSVDYPTSALLDGRSGRSIVRVTVGTDGRARDCATVVSSGDAALDRRTCVVADRGRFEPALDRDGRPTEAPYVYSINWRFQV